MTWDDSLTPDNCSWEAPLHLSSYPTESQMQSVIRTRIDRIKSVQESNGYEAGQFYYRIYLSGGLMYFLIG